jgi:predicted acetyltransferase
VTATDPEIRGCRSREELRAVVDLLDRAFDKTPRDYFERHVLRDATLALEDTRVLVRGEEIVSSVQILPRAMWVQNRKVPFGGIGNVGTDPRARRAGFAAQLMDDALARMRERGYPISVLTTDINRYYEKFGYRTVVREVLTFSEIRPGGPARPFDRARDLKDVMRIYDQYNAGSIGPEVRDEAYWCAQLEFLGEETFLVAEEAGRLIGYLRAGYEKKDFHIREFAALSDEPRVFAALLGALRARVPGVPVKFFASEREKARLDIRLSSTVHDDTDLMIAVLDESHRSLVEDTLMMRNAVTYWLTDFF